MRNKYGAIRTIVDGIEFPSKKEAARYKQLRVLERAGQIADLRMQVKYPLVVNGVKIGRYTSDFNYIEDGKEIVEDVKSPATKKARDYQLRKKLVLALYGVEIKET